MKGVFISLKINKKERTVTSVLSLNCNVLVSEGRMEANGQHRHRHRAQAQGTTNCKKKGKIK